MKTAYFPSSCHGLIPVQIIDEYDSGGVHFARIRAFRGYLFSAFTHGGWAEITEANVIYESLQNVTEFLLVEALEEVLTSLRRQTLEQDRRDEANYIRTAGHPA